MRQFKWLTQINGARYADADFGSDVWGDGSQQKPYKTLEKALFGNTYETYNPTPFNGTIVCRGYFKSLAEEPNVNGTNRGLNMCNGGTIYGDYYGAAVYDGENKNLLSGSKFYNMIIKDCATPTATTTYSGVQNSYKYLGVGYATSSSNGLIDMSGRATVRNGNYSIIYNAAVVGGNIGSINSHNSLDGVVNVVYHNIKPSAKFRLGNFSYCTVINARITDIAGSHNQSRNNVLFCNFDMYARIAGQHIRCVFDKDCDWYFEPVEAIFADNDEFEAYKAGHTAFAKDLYIMIGNELHKMSNASWGHYKYLDYGRFGFVETDDEEKPLWYEAPENELPASGEMTKKEYSDEYRRQLLLWRDYCARHTYNANGTLAAALTLSAFEVDACLFSRQTANELMNDPENLDYTLKLGSDAIFEDGGYAGAFGAALRVNVYGNSTGGGTDSDSVIEDGVLKAKTECWDNRSISGSGLSVENGKIVYNTESNAEGSILSKVVRIERPNVNMITGLWAYYAGQFFANGFKLNTRTDIFERENGELKRWDSVIDEYGLYIADGAMKVIEDEYNYREVGDGFAAWIDAETMVEAVDSGAAFLKVENPNVMDVVYVRCAATCPYVIDGVIEAGAVYMNVGRDVLWYNGRIIAPNESFVGRSGVTLVYADVDETAVAGDIQVRRIFDDVDSGWVPASMFGEYFVLKQGGDMQRDNDGEYYSSGNVYAYANASDPKKLASGTSLAAYNGSGTAGTATMLNQPFVQFKIEVRPSYS